MRTIGIDPGLGGAIAFLGENAGDYETFDMPTIDVGKGRTEYNMNRMAQIIDIDKDLHVSDRYLAVLEESQAMPGQGVRSMFMIGVGFGAWLGVLAALKVPYIRVRPAVWKKRMELPADKEPVRLRAIEQFPGAELHLKKHHGRAEALFLAAYGHLHRESVSIV